MRAIILALATATSFGFTSRTSPSEPSPYVPSDQSVHADSSLAARLTELIDGFNGRAGVYVQHLSTGYEFALRADSVFPTASMIKVPILVALMQRIEDGDLDYAAELVYRDSLLYPGEDILGFHRLSSQSRSKAPSAHRDRKSYS